MADYIGKFVGYQTVVMISIIVCSRDKALFNTFSENIQNTIDGIQYELLRIDNSEGKFSICQAYNMGAMQAKYPILCFSHEDILFEEKGWGQKIVDLFEDKRIGLAGAFGATFLSLFPIGWYDKAEMEGRVRTGALPGEPELIYNRFPETSVRDVVGVDGMLMFTRREVWNEYRFSEDILKGFHGYDIDFSLKIWGKYRIVALTDLHVFHQSGGNFSEDYYTTVAQLYIKWNKLLPAYVDKYTDKEIVDLKLKALSEYRGIKHYSSVVAARYALSKGVFLQWLKQRNSYQMSSGNSTAVSRPFSSRFKNRIKRMLGMTVIYQPAFDPTFGMNVGAHTIIGPCKRVDGAKYITIGDNCLIGANAWFGAYDSYPYSKQVFNPSILIGNNVFIGDNAMITAVNKVIIEDGVEISHDVFISDHVHSNTPEEGVPLTRRRLVSRGYVKIGAYTGVGLRAVISQGVTIGKYSFITPNSVVTRSFPDYSMIRGNPAILIKVFSLEHNKWIDPSPELVKKYNS